MVWSVAVFKATFRVENGEEEKERKEKKKKGEKLATLLVASQFHEPDEQSDHDEQDHEHEQDDLKRASRV